MTRRGTWCLLSVVAVSVGACGEPPAPQAPEPPADPVDHRVSDIRHRDFPGRAPEVIASTEFVASASELRPGGRFWLAAKFRIEPGYRLGWLNPGDVGGATKVRFVVPPGFSLGPVRLTAPERFTVGGNLVGYGYQDQLAAFGEVQAPSDLSSTDVHRFELEASWLACAKECTSERTNAYFELGVNPGAAEVGFEPELQRLFERVPMAWSSLPSATVEWRDAQALVVSAPEVVWKDFYPETPAKPEVVLSNSTLTITGLGEVSRVAGVGVAEIGGQAQFVQIDVGRSSAAP